MFDGNDALALAVCIAQHRRAHSPRRARLTCQAECAQGRLQSHFIDMRDININDSEGYAITAIAVGAAADASTAASQSGNTITSRVNPSSYEGPRRPPSPRVAHPHRPRSLRSQRGRGRILVVRARRQQTYAWGMRVRASAARTDRLTWRDARDWPCRVAAAVCGMAVAFFVLR
ncbi:hypothetical protein DFH09DRAFT_1323647 [Mycena vulgaris]|nr:hypothetical protein DFH09DRAFT_1323647 [Mycena vulgaris]